MKTKGLFKGIWRACLLGFLAGIGVGILSFLAKPDFFINFFSQWH